MCVCFPVMRTKAWRPVRPTILSPFFEVRVAGFDDFSEAEGAHDFAELDGRHVLRDVGHPDTHCGVDRKIFDAGEGLAVFGRGKRRLLELKDVRANETVRAGSENPLTICVGHGRKDSRKAVTASCGWG